MTTEVLSSLEYYDEVLAGAQNITRKGNLLVLPGETEGEFDEIAICNLGGLLPFREGIDGDYLASNYQYVAAMALAVQHLNTASSLVVKDLEGLTKRCNIRFTLEFFDSGLLENHAVNEVIRATDRPLMAPCAFLGAMRSAVSIPTSIITGLRGFPQLSAFSTSTDLDNHYQHPLFGRTIPADSGIAVPIIKHLQALGVRYLGVVYVNDPYGTAYARGLQDAALEYAPEMTLKLIDCPVNAGPPSSISRIVKFLKATEYRYFFGIINPLDNFKNIMIEAYKEGIAGTGEHTWLFGDSQYGDIALRAFPKDGPIHKALLGSGVIQASGGIPDKMPVLKTYQEELKRLRNSGDIDYLIAKSPYPDKHTSEQLLDDVFLIRPDLYSPFIYDSAIAAGLGACNAAVGAGDDYFDGYEHFAAITRTTFLGPSGPVTLDNLTGSRDPSSAYSILVNFMIDDTHDSDDTIVFKGVTSGLFEFGEWREFEPYVYADGSTVAPPDLKPPEVDQNYLGTGWRASGWVMCGIGIALAAALALWTRSKRNARVIKASQPFFLYIICFGIALFISSIFPLGVDEEIASSSGCTIACNSFLWLISLGFCITFSALYTKTRRVNKIFLNPSFKRVVVTMMDVAKPMMAILGINALVLILMTVISPILWTVEVLSEDQFGRPTETRGFCDWSGSLPFVAPLAVVNFASLLFSVTEAYRARHISIEFAESEYIFKSMLVICLAFFVGFPVLLLVNENNAAYYFFLSATIFITGSVVLMLIFIPKIRYQRQQDPEEEKEKRVRISMGGTTPSSATNGMKHRQSSMDSSSSNDDSGLLVLSHPKTEAMLRKRIEQLERQLREVTSLHYSSRMEYAEEGNNSGSKSMMMDPVEQAVGPIKENPVEENRVEESRIDKRGAEESRTDSRTESRSESLQESPPAAEIAEPPKPMEDPEEQDKNNN